MSDVLTALRAALGEDAVSTGPAVAARATSYWDAAPTRARALVRPRDTAAVSRMLAICHAHDQPVVTQGGLTGCVAGAVAGAEEVILSLERMNAIEAMEKGGTLTVRLRHSEIPGNIQLVVSDTGSGIPEHIKDRIFEPFVSTKTNQAGVGLGLAVVYGIVKNHKGNIRIESLPGAGSDFCIDLPTNLSEGNGHEG